MKQIQAQINNKIVIVILLFKILCKNFDKSSFEKEEKKKSFYIYNLLLSTDKVLQIFPISKIFIQNMIKFVHNIQFM